MFRSEGKMKKCCYSAVSDRGIEWQNGSNGVAVWNCTLSDRSLSSASFNEPQAGLEANEISSQISNDYQLV